MKLIRAPLALAAMLLLPMACSHSEEVPKPRTGDKLLDVPLVTMDGEKTTLEKLVGGRVAAFKFGTTWCGWCTKLLGEFDKAIPTYGDKVVFLDIDVKEPVEVVKAYHEKHHFKTQTVLDPGGEAAEKYNVEGFPTFLLVDHEGKILFRAYYAPPERFKPILDKAVEAAEKAKGAKADKK